MKANTKATLKPKQKQVLLYIATSIYNEHYCPSVREIGEYVGLSSTSSVQNHINNLDKNGYITRHTNKNRAIQLTDKTLDLLEEEGIISQQISTEVTSTFSNSPLPVQHVPLIGRVQAGTPIIAINNYDSDIILPTALTGNSECYLLRVQGESMRDIGIYEGDMIIVRNQSSAINGDIVVARVDDEATVKRFFKEKDHIRLQPENDEFEPIICHDCVIEGKVIGLIRDHM